MIKSQGTDSKKRISLTLRKPSADEFGEEELNRGNESTCLPNRQMSEEADDFIGNRAKQLARRLADSVDVKLKVQVPMETLIKMALVACAADFFTFENIIDTSEDER